MGSIDVLPDDIIQRIRDDYGDDQAWYVLSVLSCCYGDRRNNQFYADVIRSILFIAKGNLDRLLQEVACEYRDILLEAEEASGGFGHYFRMPFPEIERLMQVLEKEYQEEIKAREQLPPSYYEGA